MYAHLKTGWGVFAFSMTMGLLMVVVDLFEGIGLSGLAVSIWAMGWLFYRLDIHAPSDETRLARIQRTAGGLRVDLSPRLPQFRVGVPIVAAWSCFYMAAMLSYDPLWLVGGLFFGLLSLLLLPDGLRALLRHAHLSATPVGLHHRGWTAQSWLEWDDVELAVAVGLGTRQGQVHLYLREGVVRRTRHRFLVLPIDFWAWGPQKRRLIVIAAAALDDPGPVAELFGALSAFTIEARSTILDLWVTRMRDGSLGSEAYNFGREVRAGQPLTAWRIDTAS